MEDSTGKGKSFDGREGVLEKNEAIKRSYTPLNTALILRKRKGIAKDFRCLNADILSLTR